MSYVQVLCLAPGVARLIRQESSASPEEETGGILVGRVDGTTAWVTHVVGPGPRAEHGRSSFRRDGDYTQSCLEDIFCQSQGDDDYLGEWHSHLVLAGPSSLDSRSMAWVSKNPRYHCPSPLLLLCCQAKPDRWHLRGYQWQRDRLIKIAVDANKQHVTPSVERPTTLQERIDLNSIGQAPAPHKRALRCGKSRGRRWI